MAEPLSADLLARLADPNDLRPWTAAECDRILATIDELKADVDAAWLRGYVAGLRDVEATE